MKKTIALLLAFAILATFSCKKNNENSTNSNENKSLKNKYDLKSAIIKMKSTVMGMEQQYTLYFDDYGKKEASDVLIEMMGIQVKTRSLVKDGYAYTLDLNQKKGTKMKINEDVASQNIDFNNISDDLAKEMNLKKIGSETFMDKKCDVYTIDYNGSNGKFWVWKGIPLKSEIGAQGVNIVMETVEIQENTNIDKSIFEVPSDFTIEEINNSK